MSSRQDIISLLRSCRQDGVPVTVRGSGHSTNGALDHADGDVLLAVADAPMEDGRGAQRGHGDGAGRSGSRDIRIEGKVADIPARIRWDEVERQLNQQGLAARVLTNTLGLSVGGTISVGGFGVRSIRWGAQVDNVVSLRLILPDGSVVEANADENAELFRFALAGLGSVGIIERVRIRTMLLPECSRVFTSRIRSWDAMVDLLEDIAALPGGDTIGDLPHELVAACYPNGAGQLQQRYYFNSREAAAAAGAPASASSTGGAWGALETRPAFNDSREVDRWLQSNGDAQRVWGDYVLGASGFREFMQGAAGRLAESQAAEIAWQRDGRLPRGKYRNLPWVYLLMLKTPPGEDQGDGFVGRSVLSPTAGGTGREGRFYGCGFYHMVPQADGTGVADAIGACEGLTDLCISLGGRPYLHGVSPMSQEVRRQVYGPDYDRLLALRAELDPAGLFNGSWFRAAGH